jgi:thioredoxin-like negative regulator of GroEL
MMTLGWTMVLQVGLLGAGPETYATARQATLDTGKPMVVLVGAEWCPACVRLKERVLPKVRRLGLFDKVIFASVDLDEEKELGKQLARGGSIPQLVLFRHTSDGWRSRRLVGVQEVTAIEEFLEEGIAAA